MKNLHIAVAALLVLCGAALPVALGLLWPAYDPVSDYLSELGAVGAPHRDIMNFGGFLPVAILWAMAVGLLFARSKGNAGALAGSILLLGNTASYAGAAFFPCDAGCPMEGSSSQAMHNLLGVIGYLLTPPGLVLLGLSFLKASRSLALITLATAAITFAGFAAMASPDAMPWKGLAQRSVDFTQFAWMFAAALMIRPAVARTA